MIITLFIIMMFALAYFWFMKSENHLQYLKIIYPEKLKKITSFSDTSYHYVSIYLIILMILPLFLNRHKTEEKKNKILQKLSNKIIIECNIIWLIIIVINLFFFIISK